MTRDLNLLRELIKRDLAARFTGSGLGLFWAILQPAALVGVYWFVFSFMIPSKVGGGDTYLYFLISGLIPWFAISEGLTRSMTSIVENGPMVRRIPLRSELLVIVPNASAAVFEVIAFILFTIAMTFTRGWPRGVWLLPVAILLQLFLQIAIALALAATYVFLRDLGQILGFVLAIVFYLSPILYPAAGRFQLLFSFNPLTPLLGLFRAAVLGAALPPATSIVLLLFVAVVLFVASFSFFRRAQRVFADLI
ncbi:MAG TPA: ABC transporter permease [Thermoanaerobaculia bacterium]|nr:ABC transporter permease [Thermoanaerobaculia bacterium]